MYYCPRCGQPLTEFKRDIQAEQDALMDEWAERDYEGDPPPDPDKSEHWFCVNGACVLGNRVEDVDNGHGCFFKVHHPYKGPDSRPGDSWSISWIK